MYAYPIFSAGGTPRNNSSHKIRCTSDRSLIYKKANRFRHVNSVGFHRFHFRKNESVENWWYTPEHITVGCVSKRDGNCTVNQPCGSAPLKKGALRPITPFLWLV